MSFSVELFWKVIGISSQDDVELAVKFAKGITSVLNLKTMLLQPLLSKSSGRTTSKCPLFTADHAPRVVGKSL